MIRNEFIRNKYLDFNIISPEIQIYADAFDNALKYLTNKTKSNVALEPTYDYYSKEWISYKQHYIRNKIISLGCLNTPNKI